MGAFMAVIGFLLILLSLWFRGLPFTIFLLVWAIITAGVYAYEWRVQGSDGKDAVFGWFPSRPLCFTCWVIIASMTLLRLIPQLL